MSSQQKHIEMKAYTRGKVTVQWLFSSLSYKVKRDKQEKQNKTKNQPENKTHTKDPNLIKVKYK